MNNKAVATDISVIKDIQIKDTLISENPLTSYFDWLPAGYFVLDSKFNILTVNPAGASLLGKTSKDLLGNNFFDLTDFFSHQDLTAAMKRAYSTLQTQSLQLNLIYRSSGLLSCIVKVSANGKKNTNYYLAAFDSTEIKTHEKTLTGRIEQLENSILGISGDLARMKKNLDNEHSQRMTFQNELRTLQVRYNQFFNDDLTAVFFTEPNGRICDCNKTFITLFGFNSKKSAIKANLSQLFLDGKESRKILKIINIKKHLHFYETVMKDVDGNSLNIILSLDGFTDETGNLKEIKGSIIDDTERRETLVLLKNTQKKLQEVQSVKDKLFSIVSDDLQKPVAEAFSKVEFLRENLNKLKTDQLKEYLKDSSQSLSKLLSLFQSFSSWADLQQGRHQFKPEEINLDEIVFNSIYSFKQLINDKKLKISNKVKDKSIALADHNMAFSIMKVLLSYSIDLAEERSEIIISSNQKDDFYEITLRTKSYLEQNHILKSDNNPKQIPNQVLQDILSGFGLMLCTDFAVKNGGKITSEFSESSGLMLRMALPKIFLKVTKKK